MIDIPGGQKRGFAVWSRHYLECVYPRTNPPAEELNPALRVFAAPGESEPLNFIVRPEVALRDAKVIVSDIGPGRRATSRCAACATCARGRTTP